MTTTSSTGTVRPVQQLLLRLYCSVFRDSSLLFIVINVDLVVPLFATIDGVRRILRVSGLVGGCLSRRRGISERSERERWEKIESDFFHLGFLKSPYVTLNISDKTRRPMTVLPRESTGGLLWSPTVSGTRKLQRSLCMPDT